MKTVENHRNDDVWLPVDLAIRGRKLHVVMLKIRKVHFKEPFFIDTLSKIYRPIEPNIKPPEEGELLARPIVYNPNDKNIRYIPFKIFLEKYSKRQICRQLCFIFHMSRCGSTLVAQMLASRNKFYVLSEPIIINAVLDPELKISIPQRRQLLYAIITALADCAPSSAKYVFIKFRSWNTLYISFILKTFPRVRWLFIHRHGLEVMASVLDKPPGWLRSRWKYSNYFAKLINLKLSRLKKMSDCEYIARMLGSFCNAALLNLNKGGVSIDYIRLKERIPEYLKTLWGINLNLQDIGRMSAVSRRYSKDSTRRIAFKSDSEKKRANASLKQVRLIERFVENRRKKLNDKIYEHKFST